jgi:hypothetical protein
MIARISGLWGQHNARSRTPESRRNAYPTVPLATHLPQDAASESLPKHRETPPLLIVQPQPPAATARRNLLLFAREPTPP